VKSSDQIKKLCIPSVKLLGDYWSLRIIDALRPGEQRFCAMQRELDNINPATLTTRLKTLESAGVITRNKETIDKLSVTYCLTELGQHALPIIDALNNFSTKSAIA
jgi:DNA-binding HxlR family transcriptional regulator